MSKGLSYLHLGENIYTNDFILATFYVESSSTLIEAAEAIAGESSIGTWTTLTTMTTNLFNSLAPRIYSVDQLNKIVKIAYPMDLWEGGNIPQLLSGVAGNIFGMKMIQNLRLIDLELPESYIKTYYGPAFGIEGVRKIMGIYDRPLLGTIIKPKCGLPAEMHAEVAYKAWIGGCDVVKDDENLTNQSFNPFEERVYKTLKLKRKAEEQTGKKKMYVINITAGASEMLERAKFAKSQGAECVMIDILTAGFSGVQFIREQNLGMIIHGHRAMHAAFTNNPRHGVSMLVIAKAARLAGVDQLHTGTVIGKMEGSEESVKKIDEVMRTEWMGVKSTFPIASGGLHPGHTAELVRLLGKDVIINMGGGIHGHPDGTEEGAKAAYQSLEAAINGVDLLTASRDSKNSALAKAIEKWGVYGQEKSTQDDTYKFPLLDNNNLSSSDMSL